MRAATVVQQLCKSCRTCFKFYCMFYFTCDRSFSSHAWLSGVHAKLKCYRTNCWYVVCRVAACQAVTSDDDDDTDDRTLLYDVPPDSRPDQHQLQQLKLMMMMKMKMKKMRKTVAEELDDRTTHCRSQYNADHRHNSLGTRSPGHWVTGSSGH